MDNKYIRLVILLTVLILSVILIFYPYFSYNYPLHVDEWHSISSAEKIKNEGFFTVAENPLEAGFALFLYFLGLCFPLVLGYKFLAVINFIIISLVLFYFLNKKYNYWVALLGIIFFAFLRSNVNILGLWFFVPFTFAISLVYLILFLLDKSVTKINYVYYVFGLLVLLSLIHQTTFAIMFITTLSFYAINYRVAKQNYKKFSPFILLFLIASYFLYRILFYSDSNFLPSLYNLITFGPLNPQINFNPIFLYGLIPTAFMTYGYVLVYKRKELLPFRIYLIISLLNILLFFILGFTFFSSYQRYLYHFMIAAVPLSAISLYEFLKNIRSYLPMIKGVKIITILFVLIITFIPLFYNYFSVPEQVQIYHVISDEDYDAMLFLREYSPDYQDLDVNYLRAARVISPSFPGTAMYALSRKPAISGIYYILKEGQDVSDAFFYGKCESKRSIIMNYPNLQYVYSYEEIDCGFLKQIYGNEKVAIYQIIR